MKQSNTYADVTDHTNTLNWKETLSTVQSSLQYALYKQARFASLTGCMQVKYHRILCIKSKSKVVICIAHRRETPPLMRYRFP